MQRRTSPHWRSNSILLYGLGLVLALSLLFNGFLLVEQSRLRSPYDYEFGAMVRAADHRWPDDYSECQRAIEQKDSMIRQLKHVPTLLPDSAGIIQQASTN